MRKKSFKETLEKIEKSYIKEASEVKRKGYPETHKKRFLITYEIAKEYLSQKDSILDIGCVPCYFIGAMSKTGYKIEGIDINPKEKHSFFKKEKIKVKKCNIEKESIPFEKDKFDFVFLNEVFEHLYLNPLFAFKEIKRVLKKGGYLMLTTPNGYSLKRIFYFMFGKGWSQDIFTEFEKLDSLGYYGHIREYSLNEIENFLERNKFKIEKTFFINAGHQKIKNVFLKKIVDLAYFFFRPFRTHIIILAKKKNNIF